MTRNRWIVVCALIVASWLRIDPAHAGDRELEVLFVNMTPDAVSDAASKTCVSQIKAALGKEYARITRHGETKLRKRVGVPKGGTPFLEWTSKQLKPAIRQGETWFDTVILVDCQPKTKQIDVLVTSSVGGIARIRVRHLELNKDRTRWLTKRILRHSWRGFIP